LENRRLLLKIYADKQVLKDPISKINEKGIYLDHLSKLFENAVSGVLNKKQQELGLKASRLETLSPLATLSRGYSVTKDKNGRVIKSVNDAKSGDLINVIVSDGVIDATVK
jgi:exodeoxyribonuclease VII large subunit